MWRSQQLYYIAEKSATLLLCGGVSNYFKLQRSEYSYYTTDITMRPFALFFRFYFDKFHTHNNNEYYYLQPSTSYEPGACNLVGIFDNTITKMSTY